MPRPPFKNPNSFLNIIFGNNNGVNSPPYLAEDNHKQRETALGRLGLYLKHLDNQASPTNRQTLVNLIQDDIDNTPRLEIKLEDNKPLTISVGERYNKIDAFRRLQNFSFVANQFKEKQVYLLHLQQMLNEGKLSDGDIDDLLLRKAELEDLKERDAGTQLSELRHDLQTLLRDLHVFRYLTQHGKFSIKNIRDILGQEAVNERSFLWQANEILNHHNIKNILVSREVVADAIFQNFTDALVKILKRCEEAGITPQKLGVTRDVFLGKLLRTDIDSNCASAWKIAAGGEEKLNELFKTKEQREQLREKVHRLNHDWSMDAESLCHHASLHNESPDVRKKRTSNRKASIFVAWLSGTLISFVLPFGISFFICSMIAIAGSMLFLTGLYVSLGVGAFFLIYNAISLACVQSDYAREEQIYEEKNISFSRDRKEMVNLLSHIDVPELKSSYDMPCIHEAFAMGNTQCNYADYVLSGEEWLMKLDEDAKKHNVELGLKQLVQDRADRMFAASENSSAQNKNTKEPQIKIDTRLDAVETETAGPTQPSECPVKKSPLTSGEEPKVYEAKVIKIMKPDHSTLPPSSFSNDATSQKDDTDRPISLGAA